MKSNLIQRSITGALFVTLLTAGILYGPLTFALLFAIICSLALWEFTGLLNATSNETHINRSAVAAGGVYLFATFHLLCAGKAGMQVFLPYLLLWIYLNISELYLKRKNPILNLAHAAWSQLYITLPFALLNILAFQTNPATGQPEYSPIFPLAVFVFIWLSDTGAYCVGSLIGKRKLFERISPKKSWEGTVGGVITAAASSLAFAYLHPALSWPAWLGLALTVAIFGTWGDLSESLLKRKLGVKDSGNLLPGHGGMLDRFDSALLAIPAAVIYLYLV